MDNNNNPTSAPIPEDEPQLNTETAVTIIFPHIQGEIGLQQRTSLVVKTNYTLVPVALQIRAVDVYGEELQLCSKQKKDHSCVIKTLNTELFVGGGKAVCFRKILP